MWTPKKSNNSDRVDSIGRTFITPYSTPFGSSSAVSNESGGNDKGFHQNIHGSFNAYSHGSSASRSSTNTVGLPSSAQQMQGSTSSLRNTPHVLTNELSQLSLGGSHGHSGVTKTGGDLSIVGVVDYSTTQRQKGHSVHSQQYPMGRSPGLMFGAINSSHYPMQQDYDSSISGTGFSFKTPSGNQDLHFHGSGHFQQSQPRFYNTLRGKDVIPAKGSQLGPDDYGLLGLLKIIKGVNLAKTSLAVGVDPHSLGLDLNSLEPLHQKFASPWSDEPLKEGPKYGIPECYNSEEPPSLTRSHFKKFHLDMLFYVFYSMPQDQAQLFAANELHDRGWYYHRELRMWFTRDKNSVPSVENAAYEVGCYILFNPNTWQIIRQDNVVLYYDMIEQRPIIPPER